ncbi:hypothetical protein GCM10025866_25790 [Naasia aerilata]|uniref:Toprim domain-containing protein n=1 Tax=Naasia aerilata TaxID=1162966 RepID=A0ABM8GED5_9MICO|nr:hypothetical protein GCM10025866_25790 [Naasia aerilata]
MGFAPKSWDELTKHLRGRGFSDQELLAAGLVSSGDRGVYDRFRGRVVWPIRDLSGETVGFGARRLLEDDKGPKYLNTPETAVYHKAQVLYGLDLAKRDISRGRRVVVVEGYTDVMACHLAGVTTAVATCGTSFGVDHIKILRRVLGDDSGLGEVIFTFDPDAAGQKAAVRAFGEEQRFAAQTYVATGPEGLDPCDLRLAQGDEAVRGMIDSKKPMFEFIILQQLRAHDLDTVEGRVAALRAAAPVVAEIRDPSLRPGYARELARWLGMELGEVSAAVASAAPASPRRGRATRVPGPPTPVPARPTPVPATLVAPAPAPLAGPTGDRSPRVPEARAAPSAAPCRPARPRRGHPSAPRRTRRPPARSPGRPSVPPLSLARTTSASRRPMSGTPRRPRTTTTGTPTPTASRTGAWIASRSRRRAAAPR